MARLLVKTSDIAITFTSDGYASALCEATRNIGDAALRALYVGESASFFFRVDEADDAIADDDESFRLCLGEDLRARAFFYDNVRYEVFVSALDPECRGFKVLHRTSLFESGFAPTPDRKALHGSINFHNDIGRFDLRVSFRKRGVAKEFRFTSEVLSQKLDYHNDWKSLISDVEKRYPLLAADYLKQTYHSFDRSENPRGETPDLIWWNLFEDEQRHFVNAVRTVLARPRRRTADVREYRRADQLINVPADIENELREHRGDDSHFYRVASDSYTHDTVENRFVKFAVREVLRRYAALCAVIRQDNSYRDSDGVLHSRLSETELNRMQESERELRELLNQPFFRGVGGFSGFRQVSLVMQNGPGYATLMRVYAILQSSYMLYDGMRELETKNIADLYEIWCYLKIEEIVKACHPDSVVDARHGELSKGFVKQLRTGYKSEVIYKSADGVELARLIYNPAVTRSSCARGGLTHVTSPTSLDTTSSQTPDIVLQLMCSSGGGDEAVRLTYLFDAKYRIDGRYDNGIDYPPQDANNQMHRYRDALYYHDGHGGRDAFAFKKEVIGGYVLFPGVGSFNLAKSPGTDDERPPFVQSIDTVNIGAIPLRPNCDGSVEMLGQFLVSLMSARFSLERLMSKVNPQKGAVVSVATPRAIVDITLYGTYRGGRQLAWIRSADPRIYNIPEDYASAFGLDEDSCKKKVVLVLLPPARILTDKVIFFRIKKYVGKVSAAALKRTYNYPEDTRHDSYLAWELAEEIEND